jgi:hypothetical protein
MTTSWSSRNLLRLAALVAAACFLQIVVAWASSMLPGANAAGIAEVGEFSWPVPRQDWPPPTCRNSTNAKTVLIEHFYRQGFDARGKFESRGVMKFSFGAPFRCLYYVVALDNNAGTRNSVVPTSPVYDGVRLPRPLQRRGPYSSLPIAIEPMGFVYNTIIYSVLLLAVAFGFQSARRRWRMRRGLCAECGYDVSATALSSCPECGSSLSRAVSAQK